jgi:hypothetical protein
MASFLHLFDPHTGHALVFAMIHTIHRALRVDVESGGENRMGLNIIKSYMNKRHVVHGPPLCIVPV